MLARRLLASLALLHCTPTAPTRPASEPPTATPDEPAPALEPPPTPEPEPEPEPEPDLPPASGDSLSLRRTGCYGPCPTYEVTVYASGRVDWRGELFVTRPGSASAAVSPEVASELLTAAAQLDVRHLPRDEQQARCGNDASGFELIVRAADERRIVIDHGCMLRTCDERGRCKSLADAAGLRRRGLSLAAMTAAAKLADRVDVALALRDWIADPACEQLPRELFAPGVPSPDPDDLARPLRLAGQRRVLAHMQAEPAAVVRIFATTGPDVERALAQHRDELIALGAAPASVAAEAVAPRRGDEQSAAIVMTVGPRKCFQTAFSR